ncbi:NADP-dependent oxidoreductase [Massilia sp. BKSP1R2A-1]|uniref:NADP-dependent oxidoreductase n=1 Tax=Massilia sp. BKSP1R2A-1 TaxID=3422595 RepID=UPI003D32736C
MPDLQNQQILLAARPTGMPVPENFRIVHTPAPEPANGQLLLEVLYLSLDPYMRGRMDDAKSYAKPVEIGAVMEGGTVARVVTSKHPDYAPGDIVLSHSGWQRYALSDGENLRKLDPALAPISTALGVLGMPGFTAWAGLLQIGQPKPGEAVVVAAASGAVGSAVGQIARIKGARAVFPLLNDFARVSVCGLISQYNALPQAEPGPDKLALLMRDVLKKSLTIRGFIQREFAALRQDFLREAGQWIEDGRLRYREDIVDGLERAPAAFIDLLQGRNFGKLVIKVAD